MRSRFVPSDYYSTTTFVLFITPQSNKLFTIMNLRAWLEAKPAPRSVLVGFALGSLLYLGQEFSTPRPRMHHYAGHDDARCLHWLCLLAWTSFASSARVDYHLCLDGIYNLWCLHKVRHDEQPYYAPLSILLHGVVDTLH